MTQIISFVSYKGGAGRSFVTANVAEALVMQGMNVVVVDMDIEAPGVANFSSTLIPRTLFSPDHLYEVCGDHICTDPLSMLSCGNNEALDIPLKGFLTAFSQTSEQLQSLKNLLYQAHVKVENRAIEEELESRLTAGLSGVGIYESRSAEQHPLEGRMFIVPIGGGFRQSKHSNEHRNPWVYTPPENSDHAREMEAMVNGVMHELMYHPNVPFTAYFIEQIINRLKQNEIRPDFILLDQRPGLDRKTLLSGIYADGIVLVTPTSRGGMRGTRKLAETVIDLRKREVKGRHDKLSPPIIACVASGLLKDGVQNQIQESGLQPFKGNDEQVELSTVLLNAKETGHAYLPKENLAFYLSLFRSVLVGYDVEKSSSSASNPDFSANQALWAMLSNPKISSEGQLNVKDEPVCQTFLPLPFEEEFRYHDQVCDFREFLIRGDVHSSQSAHQQQVTLGLVALSAHLRSWSLGDKTREGTDATLARWRELQLHIGNLEGERPNWSDRYLPQFNSEQGWLYYWYSALFFLKLGLPAADDLALKALEAMDKKQKEHVSLLPKQYQYGFARGSEGRGDWRIPYNEANICMRQGKVSYCLSKLGNARQRIDFLFEENKGPRLQNNWAWLANCAFMRQIKSKLHEQQGDLAAGENNFDDAWKNYEQSFEGLDHNRYQNIINKALDLAAQSNQELAASIYNKLLELMAKLLNNSSYRSRILVPYCFALLGKYRVADEPSFDELNSFIVHMQEWKASQRSSNDIGSSDQYRALALMRLGEVYLELACVDTRFSNVQNVQLALENLNEAVIWDVQNKEAWLYATIARHFTYRNREKEMEQQSVDKAQNELKIVKRDTYYAAEQLIALLGNIDWFADSEDATELQSIPMAIVHYLLKNHSGQFDKKVPAIVANWFKDIEDENVSRQAEAMVVVSSALNGKNGVKWRNGQ